MRAWASQAVVARGAALLAKAGEGPTAVTTLSERSALVEAKAAAISALGVGCLKAQLRRLEPKALLWGGRERAGRVAWSTRRGLLRKKGGDARAICLRSATEAGNKAVVRSAALDVQGGSDGSVTGAIASAILSRALGP